MAETSLKYFEQVLGVITQFGVSETDCLKAAELRKIPDTSRVNADYVSDVLRYTADCLDEPLIGIKCALKYPILQYTRPAELLKYCKNIVHAAEIYRTYSPLFHTLGRSSNVITDNRTGRIIWIPNFDLKHIDKYHLHVELIMTNYLTSINWLVWKIQNPVCQLNLMHDATAPMEQYQELLDCEVKFGQNEYSIILKDEVENISFEAADSTELAKTTMNLDKAMNALYKRDSLIDRIELHIRRAIEHEVPKKTNTAKALGISERSMARDLAKKGTNFKEVKSRVLQDLADVKIKQGISLAEIALSLGYNDQPAFTRAYKRWHGYPPGKNKPSQHNQL